jgi:environmental stress-induced protein Ves
MRTTRISSLSSPENTMLINITPPNKFKKVPWKNGKGETTELAINNNGTLNHFDWRISIANVVENGVFSNFSGCTRNLTLIKGQGINLHHEGKKIDKLNHLLDTAIFDGGCHTFAELINGEITDLNVIVNTKKYQVMTTGYVKFTTVKLVKNYQYFIYCLEDEAILLSTNCTLRQRLTAGHLMQITELEQLGIEISGRMMVIIRLGK